MMYIFVVIYPGDPVADQCPAGQYCEEGTGPTDCPRLHYRDVVGGATLTDCFPCRPGYWCNTTGKVMSCTVPVP